MRPIGISSILTRIPPFKGAFINKLGYGGVDIERRNKYMRFAGGYYLNPFDL